MKKDLLNLTGRQKVGLVLLLTVLTAGSVFSLEKNNLLINIGFDLGRFYSGWDNTVMAGCSMALDYSLPFFSFLTLGGEIGISGSNAKMVGSLTDDPGFGVIPILARVAIHFLSNDAVDAYIMSKAGYGFGFWTGDYGDSKIDSPSGFMYGFDLGLRLFPTDIFGLFVEFGYEYAFLTYTMSGSSTQTYTNESYGNRFLIIGVTFRISD